MPDETLKNLRAKRLAKLEKQIQETRRGLEAFTTRENLESLLFTSSCVLTEGARFSPLAGDVLDVGEELSRVGMVMATVNKSYLDPGTEAQFWEQIDKYKNVLVSYALLTLREKEDEKTC